MISTQAFRYHAVVWLCFFDTYARHASIWFVLVSTGAVVGTHRHRTSAPWPSPCSRSPGRRGDAIARHAAIVLVSIAVRTVVGTHWLRTTARWPSWRRLVSVWSSNQRALRWSQALAYWTAGGILLEAKLTVHGTHRTFAANKRLLRLRIFGIISLGNRLFTWIWWWVWWRRGF